jgi:hypothetical protein
LGGVFLSISFKREKTEQKKISLCGPHLFSTALPLGASVLEAHAYPRFFSFFSARACLPEIFFLKTRIWEDVGIVAGHTST